MSLVIGMRCKDGFIFGSDSIVITDTDKKESIECDSDRKVWHPLLASSNFADPEVIMASVGTVRDANVIKYQLKLPDTINILSVINEVIPAIRNVLINNGFLGDSKPYDSMESAFLLASADENCIYVVNQDYSVLRKNNLAVIGCCDSEAKSTLRHVLQGREIEDLSFKEAKEIIDQVITTCCEGCTYVGLPTYFEYLAIK
jgi:hypothetical protein